MKKIVPMILGVLMLVTFAQAKHKAKLPIKADALCCGCTAVVNGTCIYRCGLCPLVTTPQKAAENPISLLPKELAPFVPQELVPQCPAVK
jgi:hypothetical protein